MCFAWRGSGPFFVRWFQARTYVYFCVDRDFPSGFFNLWGDGGCCQGVIGPLAAVLGVEAWGGGAVFCFFGRKKWGRAVGFACSGRLFGYTRQSLA